MLDTSQKLRILTNVASAPAKGVEDAPELRMVAIATFRFKRTAVAVANQLYSQNVNPRVERYFRSWSIRVPPEELGQANRSIAELRESSPGLFKEYFVHHTGILFAIMALPVVLPIAFARGWPPELHCLQLSASIMMAAMFWGYASDLRRRDIEISGRPRLTVVFLLVLTALFAAFFGMIQALQPMLMGR